MIRKACGYKSTEGRRRCKNRAYSQSDLRDKICLALEAAFPLEPGCTLSGTAVVLGSRKFVGWNGFFHEGGEGEVGVELGKDVSSAFDGGEGGYAVSMSLFCFCDGGFHRRRGFSDARSQRLRGSGDANRPERLCGFSSPSISTTGALLFPPLVLG